MGVRLDRLVRSHLQITDVAGLRLTDWTPNLYVRLESAPASGGTYVFLSKGGLDATTLANYWAGYWNDGGTFKLRCGFVDAGGTTYSLAAAYTMTVGRWYALAFRWNSTSKAMDIYAAPRSYRGTAGDTAYSLVGSTTHPGAVANTAAGQDVRIGCDVSATGSLQNGCNATLSDVRIFNSAVSTGTLDGLLAQRLAVTTAGMPGYWRLDDGAGGRGGTVAYACNGDGPDATLKNTKSGWADDPEDLTYPTGGITYGFLGTYDAIQHPLATITASDEDTDRPAANLRSPMQGMSSRTTGVAGAKTWTVTLPYPMPILAVRVNIERTAAGVPTISSNSRLRLEIDDEATFTSPPIDVDLDYHPDEPLYLPDRPLQYRYWRLSVTDAAAPGAYLGIGALSLFVGVELVREPDASESRTIEDASTAIEVQGGERIARDLLRGRRLACSLGFVRRGPAHQLYEAIMRTGGGGPVWFVPDAARRLHEGAYGYVVQAPELTPTATGDFYRLDGMVVEADRVAEAA